MTKSDFVGWNFDNSYTRLPNTFYAETLPEHSPSPELVILNYPLAAELGLNEEALEGEEGRDVFAGNLIPEGAKPIAQAYAGHQFGHFTMLGDGRAVLLGEHITPAGKRVDIQLKGSGITPFSRGGDGRAALGPMLREFIISEAMHALKIPTTRSLSVTVTGEMIQREELLEGAILTRVASSHLRVGTFQYAAARQVPEDLRTLADYAIERHFPEVSVEANPYASLLRRVIERQASLIAKWQLVGFIHGVMNTDNMTISGETIDYGPCAFMDVYDPATVFSSIDRQGRYAYGNQPGIAEWNLARFAETLLPLLHDDKEEAIGIAEQELSRFGKLYHIHWLSGMRNKLGFFNEEEQDVQLAKDLLQLMKNNRADYTNTFRALTLDALEELPMCKASGFDEWLDRWQGRLSRQHQSEEESKKLMMENNPSVIPRNHRVEEALDAAIEGDFGVMENLLDVLADPYAHTEEQAEYTAPSKSTTPYQTFCGT
ncbi:protein adenylyltransferase SelO [Sporosarcina highlanderae]|uniref:Protein nucleotidyltransferase YdiU n=1 Tax=Sporosarcina highlanderae TaxID=3035916 RepID=A0ABT8JN84_9BACL|nr:YdiU family protein [Sporosarcina highlanderae]MDN4606605.1 YdiU family protein [Sporosarcina highlanderae]